MPIAALCLGAATLGLGWAPRATFALGILPAAGGFLLHALAQGVDAPEWVVTLSPFAHLAPVPATAPDLAGTVGMLLLAVVLALAGLVGYARRDLVA